MQIDSFSRKYSNFQRLTAGWIKPFLGPDSRIVHDPLLSFSSVGFKIENILTRWGHRWQGGEVGWIMKKALSFVRKNYSVEEKNLKKPCEINNYNV